MPTPSAKLPRQARMFWRWWCLCGDRASPVVSLVFCYSFFPQEVFVYGMLGLCGIRHLVYFVSSLFLFICLRATVTLAICLFARLQLYSLCLYILHIFVLLVILSLFLAYALVLLCAVPLVTKDFTGGICTCRLHPSLPWVSAVGKLRLAVVAVQGAPVKAILYTKFQGDPLRNGQDYSDLKFCPQIFFFKFRSYQVA